MRIAFYLYFPGGGIGRYTHHLASALQQKGAECMVLCSPDYQWRQAATYPIWGGLKSILHAFPPMRKARFLLRQWSNPLLAIRYARDHGFDVLHFSNINHITFPFWRNALAKSGLLVSATVHDVRRKKTILNRRWEEQQLKAFYRFADVLFVHSEYQAQELMAYAEVERTKIYIVPHGPYPHSGGNHDRRIARVELGLPEGEEIALFFGQLRDEKNLDSFLEAMAAGGASFHLLVAGQVGSRHRSADYYQQQVRQLSLEERVHFRLGFVPETEVGLLFTACSWVALPYQQDFTSQSGVLNVAAHFQRPLLVSNAPVLKETVEQSGIGVACTGDDAQRLAQGILKLQKMLRDGHTFPFKQYLRNFSWEANARSMVEAVMHIFDYR